MKDIECALYGRMKWHVRGWDVLHLQLSPAVAYCVFRIGVLAQQGLNLGTYVFDWLWHFVFAMMSYASKTILHITHEAF